MDGKEKFFRKPWMMATVSPTCLYARTSNQPRLLRFELRTQLPRACPQVMFVGMSFCLPIAYWEQYHLKKKDKPVDPTEEPLLSLVTNPPPLSSMCLLYSCKHQSSMSETSAVQILNQDSKCAGS